MKKRVVTVLVFVFVGTLLLAAAVQAQAKAARIEGLTAYEYDCAIPQTFQPTFSGQDGHIMHIRDYVHVNVNVSESPYLAGINTTIAEAEIDTSNGRASIRGTMRLEPDAYPGSAWVGRWVFVANKSVNFGWAVAQGTGELKGMTLFMNLYDALPAGDAKEVCETVSYNGYTGVPEDTFTTTEGYILVSGRK
ncbi:MAG: hypothetical protein ACK2UK_00950 [Candidatus Promineifilaceae bacterium]